MERDFPAICDWVRHQTVSTDALGRDLRKALEFVADTDSKTVLAAQKWALVKFQVAVQMRDVEDQAAACEANGWRSSSTHDLANDVIDTISRLATGSLNAAAYLEEERRKALSEMHIPDRPVTDEDFADLPILDPKIFDR